MNSSANDRTVSLSRLLNRRLIPFLAATTILAVLATNAGAYFALKALIPPHRHVEARHIMFFANWAPSLSTAVTLVAYAAVSAFVHRHLTRPAARLARWADERCRRGDGPSLRTYTCVEEVRQLVAAFGSLFDRQATRVRQIRNLVGATRHNIRGHLSSIGSNAQFARDGKRSAVDAAERTLREVKAVTHILDVNAGIAKNFSHILGVPPTEIHIADLVHDCLDVLEPKAFDKGVKLVTEFPPGSLVAVAHRANIESVIHNLVENAVKYTLKGGAVSLSVKGDDAGILIEVADTGVGIPDEEKPRVFEYEFRGKSALSQPGDGYGLNLVSSVISLYGGMAEIRDNAPHGTVFRVRLAVPTLLSRHAASTAPAAIARQPRPPSPAPTPFRLYPQSESGSIYAILVSIPMSLSFASLLLYERGGDTSTLADTALSLAGYATVYTFFAIGWKITRLFYLRKRQLAKSRLKIMAMAILVNLAVIGGHFVRVFTEKRPPSANVWTATAIHLRPD